MLFRFGYSAFFAFFLAIGFGWSGTALTFVSSTTIVLSAFGKVAPAGTILLTGIGLAEGDRPEHIPFAREGFAVLAYELDGPISDPDRNSVPKLKVACEAFLAARCGLTNAKFALDWLNGLARHVAQVVSAGATPGKALRLEFSVAPQTADAGLVSAGLLIVNPPWTLADELKAILPELEKPLGQGGAGRFRLETPKP